MIDVEMGRAGLMISAPPQVTTRTQPAEQKTIKVDFKEADTTPFQLPEEVPCDLENMVSELRWRRFVSQANNETKENFAHIRKLALTIVLMSVLPGMCIPIVVTRERPLLGEQMGVIGSVFLFVGVIALLCISGRRLYIWGIARMLRTVIDDLSKFCKEAVSNKANLNVELRVEGELVGSFEKPQTSETSVPFLQVQSPSGELDEPEMAPGTPPSATQKYLSGAMFMPGMGAKLMGGKKDKASKKKEKKSKMDDFRHSSPAMMLNEASFSSAASIKTQGSRSSRGSLAVPVQQDADEKGMNAKGSIDSPFSNRIRTSILSTKSEPAPTQKKTKMLPEESGALGQGVVRKEHLDSMV